MASRENGLRLEAWFRCSRLLSPLAYRTWPISIPATMANGGYDAWLDTLQTQLSGLGVPVTATYWHEPHGTERDGDKRLIGARHRGDYPPVLLGGDLE